MAGIYDSELTMDHYKKKFRARGLDFSKPPDHSEEALKYFKYYKNHYPGIPHYFGTLRSGSWNIALHVFLPPEAKKTVYLIHGYLLHSCSYIHMTRKLLESGFALVMFDLPGHGFSTGEEGHIDDFADYVKVLKDVLAFTKEYVPPPDTLLGISTGCSVILDYLFYNASVFKHHVMASPLIRSANWGLSKLGMAFLKGFVKKLPAMPGNVSSDPKEHHFVHYDPLKRTHAALSWVSALYRWNDKIHSSGTGSSAKTLVIQGEKDYVVDWRYNLPFLEKRLSLSEIHTIKRAKHELFFEAGDIREEVFGKIMDFIGTQ